MPKDPCRAYTVTFDIANPRPSRFIVDVKYTANGVNNEVVATGIGSDLPGAFRRAMYNFTDWLADELSEKLTLERP